MSLADELRKLHELRAAGGLTEEEFERAKAAIIVAPLAVPPPSPAPDNLGEAAKSWVNHQKTMGVVGLVVFLIFFLFIWLPGWNKMGREHDEFKKKFGDPWKQAEPK